VGFSRKRMTADGKRRYTATYVDQKGKVRSTAPGRRLR
jgi:hypothetical protein